MKKNYAFLVNISFIILFFVGCVSVHYDYKKTENIDTIEAYEEFINKYPNSTYTEVAIQRLRELKDLNVFEEEAQARNSTIAYKEFVQKYPENLFVQEAKKRIAETDEDAYERTLLLGTGNTFQGFVDSYPTSKYVLEAKNRIKWIETQSGGNIGMIIDIKKLHSGNKNEKERAIWEFIIKSLKGSGINLQLLNSVKDFNKTNLNTIVSIEYEEYGWKYKSDAKFPLLLSIVGNAVLPQIVPTLRSSYSINTYKITIIEKEKILFDTKSYDIKEYNPSFFLKMIDTVKWISESQNFPNESFRLILKIADLDLRDETIKAIVSKKDKFYEPLIKNLSDNDWIVRESAVKALGDIKAPQSIESFIPLLKDNHFSVRKETARALGKLQDARAVKYLIDTLSDENEFVRAEAVGAFRELQDPRAIDPLIVSLNDESKGVRAEVALTLGEMRNPRAIEPLIASLQDENTLVLIRVEYALERITGQHFGEDQVKWHRWWEKNKEKFLKNR